MAARYRGNGTNFDWLRKSCDISTCDLSPDGNPEKYGRPMKSATKSLNISVRKMCIRQSLNSVTKKIHRQNLKYFFQRNKYRIGG